MPLPVGGVLVQLNIFGEIHGQRTQNSFHFRSRETAGEIWDTTLSECQSLLSDFRGVVLPAIQSFANQDWVARSIILITMVPRHEILLETRISNGNGIQGNDSLPSFCAGLLSLRTGRGGRSGHGRVYLAGVAEDTSSSSRISGENLTQLANVGVVLYGRYGPLGTNDKFEYGIYSRKIGDTREPGPPPYIVHSTDGFIPVVEVVPRVEIATMKKRQLHHGE